MYFPFFLGIVGSRAFHSSNLILHIFFPFQLPTKLIAAFPVLWTFEALCQMSTKESTARTKKSFMVQANQL